MVDLDALEAAGMLRNEECVCVRHVESLGRRLDQLEQVRHELRDGGRD